MASKLAARQPAPSKAPAGGIDNYDIDDDPFASDGDDAAKNKSNADANAKKRKDASGLGINEEVSVSKKPRVPRVKLDETRLLSENGIPKLRTKAKNLKFKGKGHEWSDTARLLSFYQLWLDDLFPKAKFLDALSMVEKAGHKKYLRLKRLEWINEGRPGSTTMNDFDDLFGGDAQPEEERDPAIFPARVATIFEASLRPKTPTRDVPDDDEDLYDATPKPKNWPPRTTSVYKNYGEPDEDDLDALMAEAEVQQSNSTSLFGNGNTKTNTSRPREEPDEDDLDALMAEAEAASSSKPAKVLANTTKRPVVFDDEDDDLDALMAEAEAQQSNSTSLFGNGKTNTSASRPQGEPGEDDLDALMAETEAQTAASSKKSEKVLANTTKRPVVLDDEDDEDDDLDALMAEAVGSVSSKKVPAENAGAVREETKELDEDKEAEAAMAEMDGLW
ncbi:Swi3-domain-containing protein [Xylariaceae sp. FL1019]|nr:Swi3-domain-containing protein [Xylariaceae sp. FL1019]